MTKKKITITIDKDLYIKLKKQDEEKGIKISTYINLLVKRDMK